LCQKIGLSLFSICLFFCSSKSFEKLGLLPEKKTGGKLWAGPPRKSAHVFLVDNLGRDCVALRFKKTACPKDISGFIVYCDKFIFCEAFSIEFVFVLGAGGDSSCAEGKDGASVAATGMVQARVAHFATPLKRM